MARQAGLLAIPETYTIRVAMACQRARCIDHMGSKDIQKNRYAEHARDGYLRLYFMIRQVYMLIALCEGSLTMPKASSHHNGELPHTTSVPTALPPAREAGINGRGGLLVQFAGYDEGLALYRQRLGAGEASLEDHRCASELLFSLERYTEALDACDQAMVLDPDDSLLHENHGTILAMLGRYEEALVSYGRACECPPDIQPLMWLNYATTLRVLGRTEAALLFYEKGLALNPYPAQAVVLLTCKGDALMDLGRVGEAVSTFDEAQRLEQMLPPEAADRPGPDFFAHLCQANQQAHALL
jgi:tetratricopeptide (TPR) repeat protein